MTIWNMVSPIPGAMPIHRFLLNLAQSELPVKGFMVVSGSATLLFNEMRNLFF